jgi:beta-fructofuranosidase
MSLRLADRWIWDSWYVKDGDTYHAFYLCASRGLGDPNRRHRSPAVGHAISKDLKNWTVVADALAPSESPAFDSWTTWTGSVIKDDAGLWWMFYTGSSREDEGLIQRIGAATSKDLTTWTKLSDQSGGKALVEADGQWYELYDGKSWGDQAWRDPWVFRYPGQSTWQMLITARSKNGQPQTRGVIGHATSENLVDWKVQPPLSEPDQGFGQYEVFQYEIVNGVPILIFCAAHDTNSAETNEKYGTLTTTYSVVVSEKIENVNFESARPVPGAEVYAARLIQGPAGDWFLMGFINEVDGKFVGELTDPIPVAATADLGLIAK